MRKPLLALLALFTLYLAAALAIATIGLIDRAGAADIIVVPGNTVRPDGTPSGRLQARLDMALELFRQQRAPVVFVSGGVGREGRDEAKAMADYLVANGVPAGAVAQDPLGVDTAATARNAAAYLRANRLATAIVATQYFHVARTTLALERSGVQVTGTASPSYFELRDVYSLAREVPAYVAYWVSRWRA
jgi:vancomycin permeability regulator SanA